MSNNNEYHVWVKASEELPPIYDNHERHFQVDGKKAEGMFDLFQGEKTFEQKTFHGYNRIYENDLNRIEWLKPVEWQQSQQPEIEDAEKFVEENFKGLADFIEDKDVLLWYKALIVSAITDYKLHAITKKGNNDSDGVELNATDFAEFTELEGYHIKGMDNGQRAAIYKLFKQSKL